MVSFETGSIDKLCAATATRFSAATEFAGAARSVLEMTAERDATLSFGTCSISTTREGEMGKRFCA